MALIGSRDHDGKAVVVFRDGQVLAGKLQMDGFVFTLNSGLQFESPAARLDRLIMRAVVSGTGGVVADKVALLLTSDGERIALAPAAKQNFALISPWGRFEFPLDDVVRISALAEPLGHRVVLRDGTRLFGYLDAAPLALATRSFGTLPVSPLALHEIRSLEDDTTADDPSPPALPSVLLAGENVLIGRVDLPALHIMASGQTLAVPPNQIRKLRAAGEAAAGDEAVVDAELGDGSKISRQAGRGHVAHSLRRRPAGGSRPRRGRDPRPHAERYRSDAQQNCQPDPRFGIGQVCRPQGGGGGLAGAWPLGTAAIERGPATDVRCRGPPCRPNHSEGLERVRDNNEFSALDNAWRHGPCGT